MIDDQKFGKSSARIVIEEYLTGPEVSVSFLYRRKNDSSDDLLYGS